MDKVNKTMEKVNLILAYVAMAACFFMMGLMIVDIVLRWLFQGSVLGSYEMTEMAMIVVIFFGLAWTQSKKAHVRVPMFVEMLPKKLEYLVEGVVLLATVVFCAFMTYAAVLQAAKYASAGATTAVLMLPYSPFGYVFALGMLLFTITLLFDAITMLIKGFTFKGTPATAA